MTNEPLEGEGAEQGEEIDDQPYGENGFEHGFKPLIPNSKSIRDAAILLRSGDDAEQFDFF
jgi:hypothetical protein